MKTRNSKAALVPAAVMLLASPFLLDCGAKLPGALGDMADAASCPQMDNGDFASLKIGGGAEVEGRVRGFLEAAFTLDKMMLELETNLIASCGELGKGLGMTDAEVAAEPDGGKGGEKVCAAVAAKIDGILKANASAGIEIDWDPPRCYADVDAMMACFGECGAAIDPGKVEASCDGGEISGKCSGECKGSCSVEAGAQCTGKCAASCSGKCEGGFEGECGGTCDGKCEGKNTKGKCEGKCEGKCDAKASGTCSGKCEGSCSASCEMEATAKCEGSCSGGCSVEIEKPKCSGEFKPPSVSVDCQMSCGLKGLASATCDPPALRINAAAGASADVEKLVASLQVSLPKILELQLGTAKRLAASVTGVVKAGVEVKDVAASAGLQAATCITAAVAASVSASASIDVNVSASASVGGSAKGEASGGT